MEVYYNYLENISLLFDAGLVVLIWMVQLIIYPSFLFYSNDNLINWHQKYTIRIAIIVIPLMMSQLIFSVYQIITTFNLFSTCYLLIVLFLWIFTFTSFVPLHDKITKGNSNSNLLQLLIKRNWIRTFLWSLILVLHLLYL